MDGITADPDTWLEKALWAGRIEDLPSRIEVAMATGLLSGPDQVARAARCLENPPAGVIDVVGRLRRLALALLAAGESRLQARVWRAAILHGIEPQNGWTRLFDAANAAGDWPTVIEAGAWLLSTPQPRPHWSTLTLNAVTKLLEGDDLSLPEAVALVLRHTGLRFLPDLMRRMNADTLADLMLADAGLAPEVAVMAVTAMTGHGGAAAARRIAAAMGAGVPAAVALAVCGLAEGRFDAAHDALDGLPAPETADVPDMVLVVWAFVAAGAGHATLQALAARTVRLPGIMGHLSVLLAAAGDKSDALPALMSALTDAGLDPLDVLDMRLGVPAELDELQVQQAIALVEADSSTRRNDRILAVARRLVDGSQNVAAVAAEFCRRNAAVLAGSQNGASLLARALTAMQDWEGALAGWDALLAHQPGAPWALGRAYFSAAKAGRPDLAAPYLAKADLADPSAQPALLNFALGACILGDYDTGARCLDIFDGLPEDSATRQHDRHNMAGRLRAALTGSAAGLIRGHVATPSEPEGAPPPRMLLLDPGFAVNDGHHFAYTLFATGFFAKEMGVDEAEVWVCARMTDDAAPSDYGDIARSLHRVFGFNPYAFEEFPMTPRILGNIARAWEAELDRTFDGRDLDKVEVIYCHSMKATMAVGLAAWVARRFGGRRIAVVVGIIEVDYMGEGPEATEACNAAYAAAVRRLRSTPGVHLVLYAETAFAVRELSAVLGADTTVHNIPYLAASLAGPASTAPVAFSGDTVTIGLVGGSRRERGLDLFPELMLALADLPHVRWIVQMTRNLAEQVDPVFPAYLQWAVDRGICTWFDGRLDTADYHAAMRRMDIVLMPYRDRYAVSGSGVFYEGIELERYLVVPQGTFMADVLRDWSYPSEIMNSATVPAALRALRRVLNRRKAVAAEMQKLREAGGDRLPVGYFRTLVRAALAEVRG